jgi:hypothetical protein
VKSSVTYGISASSYTGDTKRSYDLGYCIWSGICDGTTNLPWSGNSAPVGTVSGRRSVKIDYVTEVARARLSAVTAAANSGTKEDLVAKINAVIASVYPNSTIPAAVVTNIVALTVEVVASSSGVQSGYSAMTQTVSFTPAVDYNDATTALAYDKGYARFLGIYSTDKVYVTGTSVTGYQTSRRAALSITWVSQINCDGFSAAYATASSSGNSAALQAAIQAVITAEYAAVGTASVPSWPMTALTYSNHCSSDDGLSGADIAGIVVGSFVGALLIVGVIWYFATSSNAAPKPKPMSTSMKVTESVAGTSGSEVTDIGRACC